MPTNPVPTARLPGLAVTDSAPDVEDVRQLIAELSACLQRLTGSDGTASFDRRTVDHPRSRFVVARLHGAPVGCGALRPLGEQDDATVAELKRMYARRVAPGVGAEVLRALEQRAIALGYGAVWLATRRVNTRAVAFYARNGYEERAPFGAYASRPESICMEKVLPRA